MKNKCQKSYQNTILSFMQNGEKRRKREITGDNERKNEIREVNREEV